MMYFLIVFTVLLVILDWWKPNNLKKLHKQLKCNFLYVPVIGHSYKIIGSENRLKVYLDLARQCYASKHGMVSLWFANRLVVAIADPHQAKIVLKTFLDKGIFGKFTNDVLGNSSAYGPVEQWQHRRKVMGAILAPRYVKNFVNVIFRHSEEICDKLRFEASQGDFSVWEHFYGFSLDVISESSTGLNINMKNQASHPFFKALESSMKHLVNRASKPWLHIDAISDFISTKQKENRKILEDFTRELISKQKKNMENGIKAYNNNTNLGKTLLELMIEVSGGKNGYNDVELLEESLLLLIAGTDTTTTTAGFLCLLLSIHANVQDKAYEEIRQFVVNKDHINYEDLEKLEYLEAVIKEGLRLCPTGPSILRECDKNFEMPSGVVLQKDTVLLLDIIGINRHPTYWGSDAEEFRPERFLEGGPSHPAAFMPFSYGPRNCAGQYFAIITLKILLLNILRRYRIKPATCYLNERDIRLSADVMLSPVNKFKIQIEARS